MMISIWKPFETHGLHNYISGLYGLHQVAIISVLASLFKVNVPGQISNNMELYKN